MALDDRQLISRIRSGDDDAFELLAARQRPGLVRHAKGKLGGRGDEAEDVVQEALIKAMRALRQGADPANPAAWLRVIVARCAYDLHDADRRRPSVPMIDDLHVAPGADPQEHVEQRGEVERTVAAIVGLPTAQRQALVGYELEGRTYDELGEEHGWSVPATKSLLWRARTTLNAERRKWAAAVTQPFGAIAVMRDWLSSLAEKPGALLSAHGGGSALQAVGAVALTAAAAGGTVAAAPVLDQRASAAPPSPTLVADAAARSGAPAGGVPRVQAAALRSATPTAAAAASAPGPGASGPTTSAAGAGAAVPDSSSPAEVLRTCATTVGPLRHFTTSALRRARADMPDDLAEYSDCSDRVAAALASAAG